MSSNRRKAKAAAIRHLLETEGAAVAENTRSFNAGRYASIDHLDNYEALKSRARAIKERSIDALPDLIDRLTDRITSRGGSVYVARDADDANRHIRDLIGSGRRVVKSKSMTSEEIEVNEHLEADGIEVVETDLGEWVLQVADEAPSHIVAPALHKSRAEIARLFNDRFQPDPPLETAEELTRFARERLGELIKGADVGMTGANFLIAETGTVALVTSEGNARKSVFVPPTYIAVAGVEKIIPTVADLQPFIELLGRSGTGQDLTSYVSLFTPPFTTPVPAFRDDDGTSDERSFHLVLIDNGRLTMREDPDLKETLYCIRCSACANTCANFQSVGGHAFGGKTYSGGIATGWEAGIYGLDTAGAFNDLCTGCSRCVPACPVKIDIPWINTVVRDRLNRGRADRFDWMVDGLTPDEEPAGLDLQKRIFGHFQRAAELASSTAPVSNWITSLKPIRVLLEHILGIDRRRNLPAFRRDTLTCWFGARSSEPAGATREVVLYPDLYTNYVHVERGRAAVRALEALGARVHLSSARASGRAPLSQGMIATARQQARELHAEMSEHIDAGRDILVIEPSDLAMFRRDYRKFLTDADFERLRRQSFELVDYLGRMIDDGAPAGPLVHGDGRAITYHSHCQQRTLELEEATVDLLRRLGYDVQTTAVECCGMAGSFGYKVEYYDLSMDVGGHLQEQLSARATDRHIIAASGTSCMEQITALLDCPVLHPVQLIAPPA